MSSLWNGGPGSDIRVADTSLVMVFLLEECNLSCDHCVRESEPMAPGYRLTFDQLERCLGDCHELESVRWVHFSGGEPTLWSDGDHDLVDLLVRISREGFVSGFTTNGTWFEDRDRCQDLLSRYLGRAEGPLRLYLSVDSFHGNFDAEEGRAEGLDNVVGFWRGMPPGRAGMLEVNVITVISREHASMLPDGMVERYERSGVNFVFVPLRPVGRGESLSHLCPDPHSDRPEDLGAYRQFVKGKEARGTGRAPHIVLVGDRYYLSDPWRTVARLGRLPGSVVDAFSSGR